ncbi:hypothetical protein ACHAWF_000280 [Thalassiosira exigua]
MLGTTPKALLRQRVKERQTSQVCSAGQPSIVRVSPPYTFPSFYSSGHSPTILALFLLGTAFFSLCLLFGGLYSVHARSCTPSASHTSA